MKRKGAQKESAEKVLTKKIESEKNAERERKRVKSLKLAFDRLQKCLPSVPADTKLSKRDILILAAHRISELTRILSEDDDRYQTSDLNTENCLRHFHPIKKWPMRSRLYDTNFVSQSMLSQASNDTSSIEEIGNNSILYSPQFCEEWQNIDLCYDSLITFNVNS